MKGKKLPPPLMVQIHCNSKKKGKACGQTWAQLVAGTYFCLCCRKRVAHVVW